MKKYIKLLLLICVTFFTMCKKDAPIIQKPNLPKLYGKWNWVVTSGGFSGFVASPATVGYSLSTQFNSDGTCINLKNGQQTENIYYTITQGTSFLTRQQENFINYLRPHQKNYDFTVKQYLTFYGNDSLTISDDADDGEEILYVRQ